MIITTVWLGMIGFADDYIKVFLKDKKGLAAKFKIMGQISLGIIVAATLYLSDEVSIREKIYDSKGKAKLKLESMPKPVKERFAR